MNNFPFVHTTLPGFEFSALPLRGQANADGISAALQAYVTGDVNGVATPVTVYAQPDSAASNSFQNLLGVKSFGMWFDPTTDTFYPARAGSDNSDAQLTVERGGAAVVNRGLIYNGATWDRIRSASDNADNQAPITSGLAAVVSRAQVFDGANWDRARSLADSGDAQSTGAGGLAGTVSRVQVFNGAAWDRAKSIADNADNQAVIITGLAGTVSRIQLFDGTTWDRARAASAAVVSAFSTAGAALVEDPGDWAEENRPASAAVATITRAAGAAGVRHICTSITATIATVAPQPPVAAVLRDGATGAGAVLWSGLLSCIAGDSATLAVTGLHIVGSAATAMTLEFAAAPAATNFQSVALTGHDAA